MTDRRMIDLLKYYVVAKELVIPEKYHSHHNHYNKIITKGYLNKTK